MSPTEAAKKNPFDFRAVVANWRPLLGSFFCAISFLILFAWLVDRVFHGELQGLDLQSRTFLHRFASPPLTTAMQAVSFLGSFGFLSILFLALTVRFLLLRLRRHAAWFAVAIAGALLLETTLKLTFHRTRPEAFFGTEPSGYSFPSGHALVSFCFYGVLAGLLCTRIDARVTRILIWIAATTLVLAIGFSRIYLGVHYLTDVVAGYFAASVWVSTLLFVASSHRSVKHRRHGTAG